MAKASIRNLVGVGALVGCIALGATVVQADPSSPRYDATASHYDTNGKSFNYVSPIDPARVECTAFSGSFQKCYDNANDLYQLFELILDQLEAGNFEEAIGESLPTTPQMFPDGTVVYGVEGAASILSAWAGSNDFEFGPITNTFRYRPLDNKTVVAYGIITWTIIDYEHDTVQIIESAQTELFRRNPHQPRGWEQIAEQLAYVQPLLGDME
jgi:hypothetical protein